MSKNKKKISIKDQVLNSSIIKRVSPSTIITIFCSKNDKEAIKEITLQLIPIIPSLTIEEFKEVTTDLNKLI